MTEHAAGQEGVITAGTRVTRDIPVGSQVTAADFGTGAEPAGPQEVQVGAGGDPLMIGIPIFVVGSLVLGMALIGLVALPDSLAGIVPAILAATALFQFVTTIWALLLGQSMVASIMALFSGFWGSLALLLLGLTHNWFGMLPMDQVASVEFIYFVAWDVVFFFLTVTMLRLPVIYPAIVGLVVAAVTLVILGLVFTAATATLFLIAGICVLAFCALGLWTFLHLGSVSLGGPPKPSLGPALIK